MSEFKRGSGSALTPTQHSANLFKNYLQQLYLRTMMGKKGSGKPIIVDDTLKGKPGNTIRYHFLPQDDSDTDGVIEGQNATILGQEASMDEFSFDLSINQLAKAYRKNGKMTDQRIIFNARTEMLSQLANWWAQKSERLLIHALTGVLDGMTYLTNYTSATATDDLVNGEYRCIRADGANGSAAVTAANSDNTAVLSAMSNSDKMSYRLIVDAAVTARTDGEYKMRPIKVGKNGEEFFMLLVDPKSARDLQFSADFQNFALSVSDVFGNQNLPSMVTGALGVVDNVIVKRHESIVSITDGTSTIARNLLVGADACVLGWAQTLMYSEEIIDHKRALSVAADEIRGQTKVKYTSAADGTSVIDAGVLQVLAAAN